MKINIFLWFMLLSQVALAEPLVSKIVTIDQGQKEIIKIETSKAVSVNVSFTDTSFEKTLKCGNCLHLSHQMANGHIDQTNSSNYGTGFIEVQPENDNVIIIVKHDYSKSKKIKIEVGTVK